MENLKAKLQARMDRHTGLVLEMRAEEEKYYDTHGELMPRRAAYNERMGRIYELGQIAEMLGIELKRTV
jgi:hypothetical protein